MWRTNLPLVLGVGLLSAACASSPEAPEPSTSTRPEVVEVAGKAASATWSATKTAGVAVGEGAVHDGYTGEPHLPRAMATLSASQRKVVFLVEGLGLSQREVAGLLSVRRSTVRTHLNRGISKLREALGVTTDV